MDETRLFSFMCITFLLCGSTIHTKQIPLNQKNSKSASLNSEVQKQLKHLKSILKPTITNGNALEELASEIQFQSLPKVRNRRESTKQLPIQNAEVPKEESDEDGQFDQWQDHLEDTFIERIIDGIASPRNRWPWSVALDTEDYGFICAGTLIARQWILTAAHCVYGAPVTIFARIGAWNLTASDQKDTVPVQEIITHPDFNVRTGSGYDVALLRLVREANVNSSDILTLPNLLFNLFELNPMCYIIGWGVTESNSNQMSSILNERWVNVISHVECQTRWDEAAAHPTVYPSNLCIDEGPNGDISACQGDSGSPLQCYDRVDHKWKLAGVSSWGSKACTTYPSVYIKVQSFLPWIYAQMQHSHGVA